MHRPLLTCLLISLLGVSATSCHRPLPKPLRSGKVTSLAELQKITLPIPADVPKDATWKIVYPGVVSLDGLLQSNLVSKKKDGKDQYWYGIVLRDCRDGKKSTTKELCDDVPTEMFNGYPIKRDTELGNPFLTLVVGNFLVVGSVGAGSKITKEQLESFLKSLDLEGISRR